MNPRPGEIEADHNCRDKPHGIDSRNDRVVGATGHHQIKKPLPLHRQGSSGRWTGPKERPMTAVAGGTGGEVGGFPRAPGDVIN